MRWAILVLGFLFTCSVQAQSGYDVLVKTHIHRNSKFDPFFKGISASVVPITLGTPLAIYAGGLYHKDISLKQKAYVSGSAVLVSGGISLFLKLTVNRPRPYAEHADIQALVHSGPHSFPSAHASNAFATATSLSLLFPKWYVIAPAYTWAGLVGYSRMHLGVHYPGDVAAGALIGAGSSVACYYANRWLRRRLGDK